MSLLRLAGRPMLASMFVAGGLQSLRRPQDVAPAAEPVVRPVADRVPVLPDSTEQLVRLNGAVHVVGGIMLGLGRCPRLAALALAVTLVPTTLAAHRYWEAEDPSDRAQQRIHFLKNLSMMGGLLIAADDTGSAPRCCGAAGTPPMTSGTTPTWCTARSGPRPAPRHGRAVSGPGSGPDRALTRLLRGPEARGGESCHDPLGGGTWDTEETSSTS